jgi:uncharacterized protein (DUF362 family)
MTQNMRVSLIKGKDRRQNIKKSLELVSGEIKDGLRKKQVIIKPNFVSTSIHLASSHVEQIRGILDFLKGFYPDTVIIAEAACDDTMDAYRNFGYLKLPEEYNVRLIDLNRGPFDEIPIKDQNDRTIYVRVASLLLNRNNYLISAAKLKTHDTVVVTLSIKNMAMGSVFAGDKKLVHQGMRQINLNISELASYAWPDLAVIDGYVGMEGDGPTHGSPIDVGIAISSTDSLAADRVACVIMDTEFSRVGYLHHCAERALGETDLEKIEIIGDSLKDCVKPFRLHRMVKEQFSWQCDE